MSLGLTPEQIALFLSLPPDRQRAMIADMGPDELLALDAYFEMWAHKGQLPPPGDGWRVWLMMAGRGFGKTRAGAEWVHQLALCGGKRIALAAASLDEARGIMVEGVSGVLSVARRNRVKVKWEPSLGRITWPKGSVAQLFSGDHADGLRGPEHDFAWCDELAKWRQAEAAWDNLQMGLRAGPRPRALVTTTPRPMGLLERIRKDKWTVQTGGRTADNVSLPRTFVDVMMATYGGTHKGRQELDGELIGEVEGSLWPRALIEKCRVLPILPGTSGRTPPCHPAWRNGRWWQSEGLTEGAPSTTELTLGGPPPRSGEELDRIVVGVDPPAGSGAQCDACGIVVCAKAGEQFYVLADESVEGLSPEGWARAVAAAAARWDADRVVAEANNGGAMVASCLKAADVAMVPKLVHASRGKVARAEPVALRFEAGKAFFAGTFPELEDELAGLTIGGGYQGPTRSPDRADAMVWALTELADARARVPRVRML